MRFFVTIALLLISYASFTQCKLKITIKGIDYQKKGTIRVGVFTKNGFPHANKVIEGKVITVTKSEVTVEFNDLKEGEYAVGVVHDQNLDQKLTKNLVGYPTEPYAFSKNATGNFGPPDFKDASFKINKPLTLICITL